jgi:hypothetical protein
LTYIGAHAVPRKNRPEFKPEPPQNKGNLPGKKRGNLSVEEMAFIRRYVDDMSAEKIGEMLNRHEAPIKRYIRENRLGKEYEGTPEAQERAESVILRDLKSKPFFRDLKDHFSPREQVFFNEYWVAMVTQFTGDLIPSEEMELKELLTLDILKNRETEAEKRRLDEKAALENELKKVLAEPNKDKDAFDIIRTLRESISSLVSQSFNYVKTFKDLCDRADKMRKALHASRQDRVKDLENSRVNFTGWLKMLEEHGNKVRVAREMEVIRQAKDRAYSKFTNYETYADGEVDIPILNYETVEGGVPPLTPPAADEDD